MKVLVPLVALLFAACAGASRASSLPVVIEDLNAAAARCGISKAELEGVALRTLAASQYQPDAEAGGSLNVRVTVTASRRGPCAARVSVRMKAFPKAPPAGDNPAPSRRSPAVMFCNKSSDYSAPIDRFPVEIESAMEYLIKLCLASLKY